MIKVKKRKFLLLPGDGIGPEVVAEVKKIIQWFNSKTFSSLIIIGKIPFLKQLL